MMAEITLFCDKKLLCRCQNRLASYVNAKEPFTIALLWRSIFEIDIKL